MPTARKKTTRSRKPAEASPDEPQESAGRAIWKGSISFGLIDIPVSLHSAERRDDIHFSMLDKRDLSPIRYERVSAKSGRPVPWADVVKGYEYDDGTFVVVGEDELRAANPDATQTVDILAFVDGADIPPEYFDKPYVLQPLKRGRKGYALLRAVLAKSGRVGVAKVVVRTRQYLAAVLPRGNVLVLELLRWSDELRELEGLGVPGSLEKAGITAKELEMASKLVEGMAEDWKPDRYEDTYRNDVLALIEKKVKSGKLRTIEEPEKEEAAPRGTDVVDFMSLLKKSLESKAKAAQGSARSTTRRRATRSA